MDCAEILDLSLRMSTDRHEHGGNVALPPLVDPAEMLTIDEVRRYSRHLSFPMSGWTVRSG